MRMWCESLPGIFQILIGCTNLCNPFSNAVLPLVYYFLRGSSSGFHLAFPTLKASTAQGISMEILPAAECIYSNNALRTGEQTTGWLEEPSGPL
jgi:hypothetical protein